MKHFLWLALAGAFLVCENADAQPGRSGTSDRAWGFLSEKYDKDGDGKISKSEYERSDETFSRLDKDGDGMLSQADWSSGGRRPGSRTGGGRTASEAPRAGDEAPDFELSEVNDSDAKVRLSSFKGDKPVALIFGSCT